MASMHAWSGGTYQYDSVTAVLSHPWWFTHMVEGAVTSLIINPETRVTIFQPEMMEMEFIWPAEYDDGKKHKHPECEVCLNSIELLVLCDTFYWMPEPDTRHEYEEVGSPDVVALGVNAASVGPVRIHTPTSFLKDFNFSFKDGSSYQITKMIKPADAHKNWFGKRR